MATGRDKVTIKIPRELYQRLSAVVEGTGFGSVTEFIVFVMRDLVAAGAEGVRSSRDQVQRHEGLSEHEVDLIRRRLRALGYID